VDAFVLSGGSAFGLDAAGGAQAGLRELGRGFAVGPVRIPIVPQAILMDLLNGGDKDWGLHSPYRDMGYAALKAAAKGTFALGTTGAGTGATTATVKGGLGSASAVSSTGHRIAAIVAVNALGSATIGDGPHFWAAPFEKDAEFGGLGMPDVADHSMRLKGMNTPATTIGAVVTDAQLTKAEAHRLSLAGHDGLARALLPAHLPLDGDTVFAASTAKHRRDDMASLMELCHLATIVMARAIARGVYAATALPVEGAQKAWRDRYPSSG
jgi:D-aminopeptidase